jgi:short chain dehydrogenase
MTQAEPNRSRRFLSNTGPSRGSNDSCNHGRSTQAPEYRAAGKLQGKAALVTGGDSGIGRAVAVLYAREGADVAIVHLPRSSPTPMRRGEPSRRKGDAAS